MGILTKQDIIDAIRKTAEQNGGKPLGRNKFADEAGIKPYDWEKYWVRYGDACKEAGFAPNKITVAYADEFLMKKMVALIRKLGKFPTYGEVRFERNNDPEFPGSKSVFETKEEKRILAEKILTWCQHNNGHEDIIKLCTPVLEEAKKIPSDNSDAAKIVGEVYLFKSGRYYKIGKTNNTVRRGSELRIQLPEKMD